MGDFQIVTDFGNLYKSYKKSMRGKGKKKGAIKFDAMALEYICVMKRQLIEHTYQISPYADRFDDFSIEKNDDIDNAAYELLQSLAVNEIDWDMEMIGDVVEFVKEYLEEKHIPVCHPYYDVTTDKDIPCYRSGDCHVEECPMR